MSIIKGHHCAFKYVLKKRNILHYMGYDGKVTNNLEFARQYRYKDQAARDMPIDKEANWEIKEIMLSVKIE